MDDEGTPLPTKVAIAFGALFFAACIQSCTDLQYRLRGKQTMGIVSKIREGRGRFGSTRYEVYYDFTNLNREGKNRVHGSDYVSASEVGNFFEGQEVPVEYFGDEMYQSRITGRGSWWAPGFLLFSVFGLIGMVVVLTIQSQREKRPVRRPTGRR